MIKAIIEEQTKLILFLKLLMNERGYKPSRLQLLFEDSAVAFSQS